MRKREIENLAPPWGRTALVALGVFILLVSRALTRPLDLDEHQFLAPAILLNRAGLHPYSDFPLFHMPALVWIYAWIIKPFSDPLLITRIFSAAVGTATAMLVFASGFAVRGESRTRWIVSLGLLTLFLGARVFTYTNGWVWNHDASILALVAAVILELHALRTGRFWWFVLVGALAALSFTIRLTTAPAILPMALTLLLPWGIAWWKRLLAFLLATLGALAVLWPTWQAYLANPHAFLFGNLKYPALYAQYVMQGKTHHTGFFGKLGHFLQTWFGDPGNLVVILLTLAALIRIIKEGYWKNHPGARITTLLGVIVAVWLGLSAPFQMQVQYHAVLLPFFLLLIAATIDVERFNPSGIAKWQRLFLGATVFIIAVQFIPRWYWFVVKLPQPSTWTPMKVERTADKLRQIIPANSRVLTIDPILPLEAGFEIYPEYATGRFTFHVGNFMSAEDRQKYHILWGPELEARLAKEPPGAIVYQAGLVKYEGATLEKYANAHGYMRKEADDYVVWVR